MEDLNYNERILLKSINPRKITFPTITTKGDGVLIPPNGEIKLTREEVIQQAQSGKNKFISGVDGLGKHACLLIMDEPTKKYLGFTNNELSIDEIKKIFELKTMSSFEKNIKDKIATRSEAIFLFDCIKKLEINDYVKIRFCEDHTGVRM